MRYTLFSDGPTGIVAAIADTLAKPSVLLRMRTVLRPVVWSRYAVPGTSSNHPVEVSSHYSVRITV